MNKSGGARYQFQRSVITMGQGRDITGEKSVTIKEIAQGETARTIPEKISRHVVAVKRFLQNPCKGKSRPDCGVK